MLKGITEGRYESAFFFFLMNLRFRIALDLEKNVKRVRKIIYTSHPISSIITT